MAVRYFWLLLLISLSLSACNPLTRELADRPDLSLYFMEILATAEQGEPVDYQHEVKPLLERRCVVCHGCYDAPCQLKLSAYEGITRGASKQEVYDGTRLISANVTRLFIDAQTPQQWREKEFHAVINEGQSNSLGNLENSLIAGMLALKRLHPMPAGRRLPDSFDLKLNRDQQCASRQEFADFTAEHPLWGMPYGVPGLADEEYGVLMRWLAQGAQGDDRVVLNPQQQVRVSRWEAFLNGRSLQQQLMSRYLFEHLFIGDLYFDEMPSGVWFRLVRSRAPSGAPIAIIPSRRPFDDPGVKRFYYRLQPVRTSILAKTHLPYALSPARMQRWQQLFLGDGYRVDALPGYGSRFAANPFKTFQAIPVKSRYLFLLDDARHFISGFIKGPVCRGQVALNVINDHFWLFFLDPDNPIIDYDADRVLADMGERLRLPSGESSDALLLVNWLEYWQRHESYLAAKRDYLRQRFVDSEDINLDLVWDGERHNPNAALTVFRHFDSASVVEGLVGERPQSAWLISYNLLERIHYLLVAGFDVYGNLGHQLNTRLYMDYLRMDGEFNFLMLLPRQEREKKWRHWYRDAHDKVWEFIDQQQLSFDQESGINYLSDDPMQELLAMLRRRLGGADSSKYRLQPESIDYVERQLQRLTHLQGRPVIHLPQMALLSVVGGNAGLHIYTLLRNNAHSNIAHIFREQQRRLLQEDTLSVSRGVVGAYPNLLLRVESSRLAGFVDEIAAMRDQADYRALLDRYGVRRTSADFWLHSDRLHAAYRQQEPIEAGLFDFNRLDND